MCGYPCDRKASQPAPFARIDRFERVPEPVPPASLHLHDHKLAGRTRDEVEFAVCAAPISIEHDVSARFEVFRRASLTCAPQFVFVCHTPMVASGRTSWRGERAELAHSSETHGWGGVADCRTARNAYRYTF